MNFKKIDDFCVCDHQNDNILENYSVLLDRTAAFYKIQLVHNVNSNSFTFFCKYGGKNKNQFTIIYENKLIKEEAIRKFKDKFHKKLGIRFDSGEIDTNKSYMGYNIVM